MKEATCINGGTIDGQIDGLIATDLVSTSTDDIFHEVRCHASVTFLQVYDSTCLVR